MFKLDLLEKEIYSLDERLAAIDKETTRLKKYLANSTLSIQLGGEDVKEEFEKSINALSDAVDLEKLTFTEALMRKLGVGRREVLIGFKNYALGNDLIDENEDVIDSSKSLEQVVEEHCKDSEERMNRLESLILKK